MKEKIIVISGPTGIGKSKVAVELAKKLGNAEIISSDSMQIYKEMSIGTAKVTDEEMSGIKHHMIDEVSIHDNFSVYDYQKKTKKLISDMNKRGTIPIIIGGTGLYINSLLYKLDFSSEAEDKELREKLNKEEELYGKDYLYNKLKKLDPEYAEKLSVNDTFRIIRALEVIYKSGNKYSEENKNFREYNDEYDKLIYILQTDRELLYDRINKRIDKMIAAGLLDEVKDIIKDMSSEEIASNRALLAIGYKELISYLQGEITYERAVDLIKQKSRNYAKRQLTWFRRESEANFIDVNFEDIDQTLNTIYNDIMKRWKNE
ncbi:tRNA (adenosine(37)-N6)-dimethylallyltransferase MiaA [uncultured Fenollaria sp.]|uniref:tRNA (adenosine(37)-N6)-dimethylallyltransferase MiaA n=1 Tax=uncultured Fenollaria sp. TaxID=1686315 RepID=UPI0025F754DB|nr:tRNA (adenosine(37)-N6)-dimethylallyltransferase MiaA [uncultured Fenollaria sp.]